MKQLQCIASIVIVLKLIISKQLSTEIILMTFWCAIFFIYIFSFYWEALQLQRTFLFSLMIVFSICPQVPPCLLLCYYHLCKKIWQMVINDHNDASFSVQTFDSPKYKTTICDKKLDLKGWLVTTLSFRFKSQEWSHATVLQFFYKKALLPSFSSCTWALLKWISYHMDCTALCCWEFTEKSF